jgi:hypothetical protein
MRIVILLTVAATVVGGSAAFAQTTGTPNSGAGVQGLPGNKSGSAAKSERAVNPAGLARIKAKFLDCPETNPGRHQKSRRSSNDAERARAMRKISTLAAVLLVGTVLTAYAQKSPGASEYSPGDRIKDQPSTLNRTKGPGASSYAPGHEQKAPGTTLEATEENSKEE